MSGEVSAEEIGAGGRKKLILLIGAFAVTGLVAAGLWFSGIIGHLVGHASTASASPVAEQTVLIDLPDIVSNLDVGNHRASFIKLHAKLKVARAADATVVQSDLPQILDIFQSYLRSTRPEELRGGEGTYRLREALMSRIDANIAPVRVVDLFFTELLVQ